MVEGPSESDDSLVGWSVKHFRIVSLLGQGGMGVVYRAVDETLGREVALKVLRPDDARDEERRRRFLREARSAAAITHPNIATVYEIGEHEGHAFIAMELVAGATLRAQLANGLEVQEAVRIVRDIARGLSRAHEKGVVHRDLKPENVMLTGDGEVKILDFGLAKLLDGGASDPDGLGVLSTVSQATAEGRVMGTPAYMSPEQAEGRPTVGPPSDVFSVGVIFYELLAGVRPFRGTTGIEILYAVIHREPPSLAALRADVPPAIVAVVERCLAKPPGERFPSGRELLAALEPGVVDHSPTPSGRSSGGIRALEKVETLSGMGTALGATVASGASPPENAVVPPRRQGSGVWSRVLVAAVVVAIVGGSVVVAKHRQGAPVVSASPLGSTSAQARKENDGGTATGPAVRAYRELRVATSKTEVRIATLSPDASSIAICEETACWAQPATGGTRHPIPAPPMAKGLLVSGLTYFPDGKRVLWTTALPSGAHATSFEIPLDGSPARSRGDLGESPIVSPDGARVAIATTDRIEVATLEGRLRNRVATCNRFCSDAAWSPDGQSLAYVDGFSRLSLVSLRDGSVRVVFTDEHVSLAGAIVWPTTNHILFGSAGPESGYVVLRDATLDDAAHSASDVRELWRARGDSLKNLTGSAERLAVSVNDSLFDVYVGALSANGDRIDGDPKRLSMSEAADYAATWQWDGSIVYYSERSLHPAFFVQDLVGGEARVVVADPVVPQQLVTLRDGSLLCARPTESTDAGPGARLFVRVPGADERALGTGDEKEAVQCGDGRPDRCIVMTTKGPDVSFAHLDLKGGNSATAFYRGVGANADTFAVSPDGRTVVALKRQREVLTVIDVATGESYSTTTSPKGELKAVTFSRDGASLLLTGMNFGASVYGMIRVDLKGHGDFLKRSNGTFFRDASESPDGRHLLWTEGTWPSEVLLLERR